MGSCSSNSSTETKNSINSTENKKEISPIVGFKKGEIYYLKNIHEK